LREQINGLEQSFFSSRQAHYSSKRTRFVLFVTKNTGGNALQILQLHISEILSYNGFEKRLFGILLDIERYLEEEDVSSPFSRYEGVVGIERSLYSDQTFKTITVLIIWGNVPRLPVLLELFFHGTNSRLNVHRKSTPGEDVRVDFRIRKDSLSVVRCQLSDVPIPSWVVGRTAAPCHSPLGGQRRQRGVVHGGLVPLVVTIHGTVEGRRLGGVGSRRTGGRGLQAGVGRGPDGAAPTGARLVMRG